MSVNESKRLVFHTKVPSLTEMSCYAIGLEYLRGEVVKCCSSNEVRLFRCFYEFKDECVHYMRANLRVNVMERIPKFVKEMIDKHFESLKVELEDWLNFHFYQVLWHSVHYEAERRYHASAVAYLNDLIWFPNGTIDYTKTARNLLRSNKLTDLEKYRIACAYCFEEEINRLGPSCVDLNYGENIGSGFLDDFWYERVQKKISNEELPAIDYDYHITDGLVLSTECRNWWAVEYFLNNLQSDEVVNLVSDVCCADLNAIQMLYWLPTLGDDLTLEVLNACGHMLVRRLIRYPKYSMQTLQIWSYIKSTISESHFLNMIIGIHRDNVLWGKCGKSDDGSVILYDEILKSTPDELKYPVLSRLTDTDHKFTFDFFHDHKGWPAEEHTYFEFPRDFRTIIATLLNASFEQRNKFWKNNWKNLLWGSTPFHLNELMRLCFNDETEIIQFKESNFIIYDNIKKYCINLVHNGKFTEMDNFLNFCTSNEQTVVDLRKKIMDDPLRWSNSAKQYKKGKGLVQYASSFDSKFEFVQDVLNDNELLLAKEFVILFSSCDQDLCKWKKILVDSLRTHIVEKKFTKIISDVEWVLFTDWLFANREEMLDFKKSLPMGEMFVKSLSSRSPPQCDEYGSCFMNYFLKWYFFLHPETASHYLLIKNCLDLSIQRSCEFHTSLDVGSVKIGYDQFCKRELKECFSRVRY